MTTAQDVANEALALWMEPPRKRPPRLTPFVRASYSRTVAEERPGSVRFLTKVGVSS